MSDERSSHPLSHPTQRQHPLSDRPPERKKPRGVLIPIPQAAKVPVISYALIVINVAIFALRYIMPELSNEVLFAGYNSTEAILRDKEFYRLFTSMFLHFNEAHILFNGIALYYIGTNLEKLFGHLRFALIYVLGGLAGSVLPLFVSSGGLGASGAVFAIWGAEVAFMYHNREIFGAAGRERLKSSMAMMLVNFIAGFSANALASVSDSAVRVSNAAHFGGLAGGALLGWFIAPRFLKKLKENVKEGEVPIEIVETNPLQAHLAIIGYFCIGLVAFILIAMLFRT